MRLTVLQKELCIWIVFFAVVAAIGIFYIEHTPVSYTHLDHIVVVEEFRQAGAVHETDDGLGHVRPDDAKNRHQYGEEQQNQQNAPDQAEDESHEPVKKSGDALVIFL